MNYRINILIFLIGIIAFWACAGGSSVKRNNKYKVHAGIDSVIAREADSLASILFIKPKAEQESEVLKQRGRSRVAEGDSLWQLIELRRAANKRDSLAAIEAFNNGAKIIKSYAELQKMSAMHVDETKVSERIDKLLIDAIKNFQKALYFNPFDSETHSWLAHVYTSRASRFEEKKDFEKATYVLEELIRLDKGNHSIYARLAENYYAIEAWKAAYDVFCEAERVLTETGFLNIDKPGAALEDLSQAAIDSSRLFNYVFYQGVTQSKLYNADSSLAILDRAMRLAPDESNQKSVQSYIDWINWDDGNIHGSERRDELLAMQAQGNYKESASGFWKLAKKLRTERARDEIEWRASVLTYQRVGDKEKGVKGLHELIDRYQKRNAYKGALDSTYARYFDDYAIMCHNLGLEEVQDRDWQAAYAYFLQATTVQWRGSAKSHLEIAKIVQNNPELVLKHCKLAQKNENTLDIREHDQLYSLLSIAYLKLGKNKDAMHARYQRLKFKAMKE
ncbi:MAG: hypothetical protein DWQ05_12265 [Calditrichaeota bacterium]|nr:MAG: hypothetical protein DWQ05_12265 [Calditrichota bacterium]